MLTRWFRCYRYSQNPAQNHIKRSIFIFTLTSSRTPAIQTYNIYIYVCACVIPTPNLKPPFKVSLRKKKWEALGHPASDVSMIFPTNQPASKLPTFTATWPTLGEAHASRRLYNPPLCWKNGQVFGVYHP